MNLLQLMNEPRLIGPYFADPSWDNWKILLAAAMGLPQYIDTEAKMEVFRACTGRTRVPTTPVSRVSAEVGRRGGKSRICAAVATHFVFCRDYSKFLAPGEKVFLTITSIDRAQSMNIMRFFTGLVKSVPAFARRITSEEVTGESIEFGNVVVEIRTPSKGAQRGYTLALSTNDEVCWWFTGTTYANPDFEILAAQAPALSTIPDSMIWNISTPRARVGFMYEDHRKYFGVDDAPVLVWNCPSRRLPGDVGPEMNPTLAVSVVERAYADDSAVASAEYGAQYRRDLESIISHEMVENCRASGRTELLPVEGVEYTGFCDPSGGSSDSMTLGIAHQDNGRAILDLVREDQPPFNPDLVTKEYAALLKRFRCTEVWGDAYGGIWPQQRFAAHGITYRLSPKTRSELYLSLVPLLSARTCELLDHRRLLLQLVALERRVGRSGKDSVDHPPNSHDDIANCCAGALIMSTDAEEIAEAWCEVIGLPPSAASDTARWPDDGPSRWWKPL